MLLGRQTALQYGTNKKCHRNDRDTARVPHENLARLASSHMWTKPPPTEHLTTVPDTKPFRAA